MCGKVEYRLYRVICNGFNRPKAIVLDGGKIEIWKKNFTSNFGTTRTVEMSKAIGLKRDFFILYIRLNAAVRKSETPCMEEYNFCWFWEKYCNFWNTKWQSRRLFVFKGTVHEYTHTHTC
jgi:hypothetical protein